jgi:hypothetical protein
LALPGLVTDRARLVQRMGAVRTGRSRSVAATAVAMIAASAGKPKKFPELRRVCQRWPMYQTPGSSAAVP